MATTPATPFGERSTTVRVRSRGILPMSATNRSCFHTAGGRGRGRGTPTAEANSPSGHDHHSRPTIRTTRLRGENGRRHPALVACFHIVHTAVITLWREQKQREQRQRGCLLSHPKYIFSVTGSRRFPPCSRFPVHIQSAVQ